MRAFERYVPDTSTRLREAVARVLRAYVASSAMEPIPLKANTRLRNADAAVLWACVGLLAMELIPPKRMRVCAGTWRGCCGYAES